jgi:hypothetical protein
MIAQEADFGTLAPLVQAAGWLMSASIAIALTWRRRAKWEPSEEDVPQGPARVAGMLTAVAVALVWVRMSEIAYLNQLTVLAITTALAAMLFLLAYGFLVTTNTYVVLTSPALNQVKETKIIGGFSLMPHAKAKTGGKTARTVQEVLAGAGYDVDKVWPRASRAAAKAGFVVCYIGLTVCGTIAITAAAMMFLLAASTRAS